MNMNLNFVQYTIILCLFLILEGENYVLKFFCKICETGGKFILK